MDKHTKGLKIVNNKYHAVIYIHDQKTRIKKSKTEIVRLKSGISSLLTPKQYTTQTIRNESTGKVYLLWKDNFIHQNLSKEDASRIIKYMDTTFKQKMIEEGYHSRTIHNDLSIGTEYYEYDNLEELVEIIEGTWDHAYKIAYEFVLKQELYSDQYIPQFEPRYKQDSVLINPTIELFKTHDKLSWDVPGGSGKSKCNFKVSEEVQKNRNLPWKFFGVSPNIANTVQFCNEFAYFYKGQTGERLVDIILIGSANPSDYKVLDAWANVYSASNDRKLLPILKRFIKSNKPCAIFIVNDSVDDLLNLAKNNNLSFKDFFGTPDEIQNYSSESGQPKMIDSPDCSIINYKKYGDTLPGKLHSLSASFILRDPLLCDDPNAVFNDDLDKFGKVAVKVEEWEARKWGWNCDKKATIVPIPTDDVFISAIEQNASFVLDLNNNNIKINPLTFVGVEGISLFASNHSKIIGLVSRKADVKDIIKVLKYKQELGLIDPEFELIEGYAKCGISCVNRFNRAKKSIIIATRWIVCGVDTYTADCTLPLYTPGSKSARTQFDMRGSRKYGDKISTFGLICDPSNLTDSPWFERIQRLSNSEPLEIISESRFRQESQRTIGGRGNVTLVRPEREIPPTIWAKYEEIAKHCAIQDYVDENGETLFSKIVWGTLKDVSKEEVLELVLKAGYTRKIDWQEDTTPIDSNDTPGRRYYWYADSMGFLDWVVEHANLEQRLLQLNLEICTGRAQSFLGGPPTNMSNSKNKGDQAAYQWLKSHKNEQGIRYIDVLFPTKFKSGPKSKDQLTPEMVKQWIVDNNLQNKDKNTARSLSLKDNKSSINYAAQRVVKAYSKFHKEGKIETLLLDARSIINNFKLNK